jgi:hypothetical protein
MSFNNKNFFDEFNNQHPDIHKSFFKNIKSYSTFPKNYEEDIPKFSNNYMTGFFSCMFIFTLMIIAFNSAALYFALLNNEAVCYENKYTMSLSLWLIIGTSVCITYQSISLIYLTMRYLNSDINLFNINFLDISLFFIYKLLSSIFIFIMLILGIIELTFQYDSCKKEVYPVTTMTIIIIVINCLNFVSLCST